MSQFKYNPPTEAGNEIDGLEFARQTEQIINSLGLKVNQSIEMLDSKANDSHNHDEIYAEKFHRHEYATLSHTHNFTEIFEVPQSFPANGGNADTINGLSSSDFVKIPKTTSGVGQVALLTVTQYYLGAAPAGFHVYAPSGGTWFWYISENTKFGIAAGGSWLYKTKKDKPALAIGYRIA